MYFTNEELDQYTEQIKTGPKEYLKSVVPQIILSLRKNPNNYLAFGIYWYHVKKVIQAYTSGDDWFYGDFHDQLIMEMSDHGDDFRNVVAALVYADNSDYFSSSTHTYTWKDDPRTYILEDDDFLSHGEIIGETATEGVKPASGELGRLKSTLEKKYKVKMGIFQTQGGIEFSKLIVPEEDRNKGTGSKVMNEVTAFADKAGLSIGLTPSKDFGGNLGRLKRFYKKFGFVDNKGKNKSYSFMTTMIRDPKGKGSTAIEDAVSIFPDIEGIVVEAASSINFENAIGQPLSFLTDQIKDFSR